MLSPAYRYNGRAVIPEKERAVVRLYDPLLWVFRNIPRNQAQLEKLIRFVLKPALWVALLAPIVLVPIVYLILAIFGLHA